MTIGTFFDLCLGVIALLAIIGGIGLFISNTRALKQAKIDKDFEMEARLQQQQLADDDEMLADRRAQQVIDKSSASDIRSLFPKTDSLDADWDGSDS